MRFLDRVPNQFVVSLVALICMAQGGSAQNVAFIVNNVDLSNAADAYINDILANERLFEVTLVSANDDAATTLAAAEAADLTIVSESVGSGAVGVEVKDATKPVLFAEPYLYDDYQFVPSGTITNNFDPGDVAGNTPDAMFDSLTIAEPSHPMAAGLTGDVPMYVDMSGTVAAGSMSYARVQSNPAVIATLPGNPDAAAIFVHEPGDLGVDGSTIPGMRIGFSATAITFTDVRFSEGGLALFNAAIDYALGDALQNPGDVDGDGDTDLADYEIIRDHFQQTVTMRTEGDLNRDGLVDFRDFRRWKRDPNLAASAGIGAGNGAIPEPTSAWLAVAALVGVAAPLRLVRRR